MTRIPRTALVAAAALGALAAFSLAGCGSDEATTTTTAADSPTTTATDDSTADDSTTDDSATEDDAADSDDAPVDGCTSITVDEVAAIVGGPVTVEEMAGGGCNFSQEDLQAPSVSFNYSDVGSDDTDGTFNSARVGAFGVLTDPTTDDPALGEGAAVASGTIGGDSQQGVGVAQQDSTIVQVTVLQGVGLDGTAIRAMTAAALTLGVSKV